MKASLDWRESGAGLAGRPALRGASRRRVDFSRAATKAGVPSGRPVWVERRRVARPLSRRSGLNRGAPLLGAFRGGRSDHELGHFTGPFSPPLRDMGARAITGTSPTGLRVCRTMTPISCPARSQINKGGLVAAFQTPPEHSAQARTLQLQSLSHPVHCQARTHLRNQA